jgi:hypothetical protein
MNASKKIAIGFLVFVFGMIFFSLIFAGCDKITSSNKNNSEESSSFDKSILETNSTKKIKNLEVPINDKWEVENDKDDSIYENDYCYTIDGNNGYIFMWVRSQKSDISLESSKDYFDNDSDYKNKHSEIFELFDGVDALDTTHLDSSSDNYSHTVEFIADGEDYEIEFYGDKSLKKYMETLYNNVIGSDLILHNETIEETTTTTEEPTTEDYDSDDDYDYDYDYEEETTTKPKKDTLVYSNSKINIYFQDVTTEYDETYVNFKVKNKSSKKLDFQADTITLDGISYNDIVMSDPVAPQSTGIISAQVEKAPYKQPKTVGAELRCFDDNLNTDNISFVNVKVK